MLCLQTMAVLRSAAPNWRCWCWTAALYSCSTRVMLKAVAMLTVSPFNPTNKWRRHANMFLHALAHQMLRQQIQVTTLIQWATFFCTSVHACVLYYKTCTHMSFLQLWVTIAECARLDLFPFCWMQGHIENMLLKSYFSLTRTSMSLFAESGVECFLRLEEINSRFGGVTLYIVSYYICFAWNSGRVL